MAERVIVLEGLPAAGKTCVANSLRDNQGYTKINESLGRFNLTDPDRDQRVVFDEMVERYQLAAAADGSVIIDRGYPTILAWDYTAECLGTAHDLTQKEEWVGEALAADKLFEPDLYVYLHSTPDLSFQRRPRPPQPADVWSTTDGMEAYTTFCDAFFQVPEIAVRTLHIDATALPLAGIVRSVETGVAYVP